LRLMPSRKRRPKPTARRKAEPAETTPQVPAEPTLAELFERSDALRRTAESLHRRMEDLAARIDTALSKREGQAPDNRI
jgi:hypothetical protein